MKYLLITILLGVGYSQCDANGDGDLNIQDIIEEVNCILTDCWEGESVCEDIDGNVYETIQIGEQLWMAENLKVTHYNDGSEIPTGYSNSEWGWLDMGAYAVYDDDPSNADVYGNLYNWYTVDDDRAVCPEGWHVPSDDEFTVLTNYLGGEAIAGGKMKEAGTEHWNSPNTGATNESGFTGLPSGYRNDGQSGYSEGEYLGLNVYAFFWMNSYQDNNHSYVQGLYNSSPVTTTFTSEKRNGLAVRCLKD